MSGFYNKVVS